MEAISQFLPTTIAEGHSTPDKRPPGCVPLPHEFAFKEQMALHHDCLGEVIFHRRYTETRGLSVYCDYYL